MKVQYIKYIIVHEYTNERVYKQDEPETLNEPNIYI